jgi:murein DD-endopeptidase MepM/ murein hydrolase activator NlpD
VRRRLAAIIGVAFCLGALTALWAARPWERPIRPEDLAARVNEAPRPDVPVETLGTYREPAGLPPGAGTAPVPRPESSLGVLPVPALPPASTDNSGPPASTDAGAALPADLRDRRLVIPVQGVKAAELQPTFHAQRGTGEHEALDVHAPKGTPVLAVEDGEIVKLFYSVRGGKTVYQFDRSRRYCYYYAHLDSYAGGLAEKQQASQGQVIGYVGSTGNAKADAPHLHFAIFKLTPEQRWWQGNPVDPYPVLTRQ